MNPKNQNERTMMLENPQEHIALEQDIRALQAMKDPFMQRIPNKNIQEYISTVTQEVVQSLTAASQTRNLLQKPPASLDLISLMILRDKDMNAGRMGTDQDFISSLTNLKKTNIGNECLLRVLYAISSLAIQNMLPFLAPQPSLAEIHKAATSFAAQPLHQMLMQEAAYREALNASHS